MSAAPGAGPAYRIETPRLVIRCWEPKDAPLLKEAVDSSLEHLRAWLPWAWHEPTTLDEKIARLRRFRSSFDLDDDFVYAIFSRDERRVLGGSGLHTRIGSKAREIGYWIRQDSINQGLVTEAAAALTRVGFEIGQLDRIEIHVDTENHASAAVPPKLGYHLEATLKRRLRSMPDEMPPEERTGEIKYRDSLVFSLFASQYPATPCAAARLRAFDAAGRVILDKLGDA